MHSIYLVFAECRHILLDSRALSCPHSVACAVFGHAQIPENPIAAKTPKGRMSLAQRKAFKASQVEMVKKNHGRQGSKKQRSCTRIAEISSPCRHQPKPSDDESSL